MEIRNISNDGRDIPRVGVVEPGETIEVDNDLGKNLIEQSDVFEKVTPKRKSTTEGDS